MKENDKCVSQTKNNMSKRIILLGRIIISNNRKDEFGLIERAVVDNIRYGRHKDLLSLIVVKFV